MNKKYHHSLNYLLPSIQGGARGWVFFFFLLFFPLLTFAQSLPIDPAVRYGTLSNGLTYYICPNQKPTGQAEFYIVQRVGSILEEEDQRGLAHFLDLLSANKRSNNFSKILCRIINRVRPQRLHCLL